MTKPIFISYASKDHVAGEGICDALAGLGHRAWIASRDIGPGENFQEAIVAAIRSARIMVLIFSANANASDEIKKELALASQHRLAVIPVRIEDVPPIDAFSYELATRQWIDLFKDRERGLERLAEQVAVLLAPLGPRADSGAASVTEDWAIPTNLPVQVTSFIGREVERATLSDLVLSHSLVTLVGAGGLGKTRLSLEAAGAIKSAYPDGVWFLELAPLADGRLVAESLANLLGAGTNPNQTATETVTRFLRVKRVLIILDNCEHLVPATAALATAIITQCPRVSIMASSREALGIAGEQVFRMPHLASPAASDQPSAAEALAYPAVRLFVERAAASTGGFTLTDVEAPTIAAICRRLDGIALAIELAAPRLKMMKPAQLLTRLDDRFKILTGGSRTALPRQQTLRALIDWSHDLLSEPERIVMRRLAVFGDGWTLDAATEVVAGDPLDDWEVFDLVASLVDKSLVVADSSGAETRYRFFETTRDYAAERLDQAGEGDWRRRLADYMVALLRGADESFEITPTDVWLTQYGPEIGNLRAAVEWAFGPTGGTDLGVALVAFGQRLWNSSLLREERRRWFEIARPLVTDQTPVGIAARIVLGRASRGTVTGIGAREEDGERAIALARQAKEPLLLARALCSAAVERLKPSTIEESEALLEEALSIVGGRGKSKLWGRILEIRGSLEMTRGRPKDALDYYQESLGVLQKLDSSFVHECLANMAEACFDLGDLPRAIELAREVLDGTRANGEVRLGCLAGANLAAYLLSSGDVAGGAPYARQALIQALELDEGFIAGWAIQHMALVAARSGGFDTAALLLGYVDHVYQAEEAEREATEQTICELVEAALASVMPEPERLALRSRGASLSRDAAAELALALRLP